MERHDDLIWFPNFLIQRSTSSRYTFHVILSCLAFVINHELIQEIVKEELAEY